MDILTVLKDLGFAVAAILVIAYIMYMIGLILVLHRLGRLSWMAFIPILNYYAQVRAINAPFLWFIMSFPPYIGAVYAGSVALRLGAVFNKGPAFSLFWLTLGAPIGMFIVARSKEPINLELLEIRASLLDVRSIRAELKAQKKAA